MAIDTDYAIAWGNGIASVANYGTANPLPGMANLTSPWVDCGSISTAGLAETLSETRTNFKRWGSINSFRSVVTDQTKSFDVSFLEANATVLSLFYKVPAGITPTGAATNEVQSVTITGAPTGGSFTLVFNGVATPDIAYNATASAVQTALQALSTVGAGNATVTGSAGGPYTVTFVSADAGTNVPQMTSASNLTGGTSPAVTVATGTQGAPGTLLRVTDDTTGVTDVRSIVFDVVEGTNHVRFFLPKAEITARKNPTYATGNVTEYGMTVTAYPNDSGVAVDRMFQLNAVAGLPA